MERCPKMSTIKVYKNNLAGTISDSEEDIKLKVMCEELRQILSQIPLKVPMECSGFLKCCLRVKRYDLTKVAKIVQGVHNAVLGLDKLFDLYDCKLSELIFNQGILGVLKNRVEFGRNILLWRIGRWHPNETSCEQMTLTLIFLYLWIVGKFVETQRKGAVYILDLTNFGFEQLHGARIWLILHVIKLMQDSNPGKIKAIHIIHNPSLFQMIFKLVKPVLKEKLYNRIHFHNHNATSLHKFVAPELLPVSLGGHLGEEEVHDADLMRAFLDDDSFVPEMRRLGFPKI